LAYTEMLDRLFRPKPQARPRVPDGEVVFAIGDMHGRADLLEQLIEAIFADEAFRQGRRCTIIGLGDYVDRGSNSCKVLETLIALSRRSDVASRFLRGNHEQCVLDFLQEPAIGRWWSEIGGRELLASYGVQAPSGQSEIEDWTRTRDAFAERLPADHLDFLKGLELSAAIGDYFFVHAGARPGVPLEAQAERDLIWIRDAFLSDPRAFDKVVVHGHSVTREAHLDHRRIGIDTAAFMTDVLTAVRLEGESRSLMQTGLAEDGGVTVSPA
jgi:serine/threonine protein phosphatase 1